MISRRRIKFHKRHNDYITISRYCGGSSISRFRSRQELLPASLSSKPARESTVFRGIFKYSNRRKIHRNLLIVKSRRSENKINWRCVRADRTVNGRVSQCTSDVASKIVSVYSRVNIENSNIKDPSIPATEREKTARGWHILRSCVTVAMTRFNDPLRNWSEASLVPRHR